MREANYRDQALAGSGGVDLIVALYDGAIRFLYRAVDAVEARDTRARREAVKKAVDIFMYLQARLRPDVGGTPAVALSDFYAAMFTLTLEASAAESVEKLNDVIKCVRNVREAWVVVAKDPEAARMLPRELRTREEKLSVAPAPTAYSGGGAGAERASRWSA